jgi:hypothetical protein
MEVLINLLLVLFGLLFGILVVVGGIMGVFFGYLYWQRWKDREVRALDFVLLQIAVPKENEVKIDAMEQMLSSLHAMKKAGGLFSTKVAEHIALEIVARPGDIRFYIAAPRNLQDLIEKQIHGVYAGADVRVVDEYNIFFEEGVVSWAQMGLSAESYKPIKLYKELPTDPLNSITSALAKMKEGEGAAIQIILSPAGSDWRGSGKQFVSGVKKSEADPEKAKYKVDARTLEAIESKITKPGFEVTIRVVVTAEDEPTAEMHLNNIKSTFEQFNSDQNGFISQKVWIEHTFMTDFIYRYPRIIHWFTSKSVLTTEELATIYHFPNKTVETPNIYWLRAKRAPAPANIPTTGFYLGKSIYRGQERLVYMGNKDRQRHMYLIGKTGVGKSEYLRELILQDIEAGHGVALIDPHDMAEDLLNFIPPHRAEDVVYFDPGDVERPMGLNMMEASNEKERHLVTGAIINLMYKLYDPHKTGIIGPRFEHAIRNAMLTVMEACPGGGLIELVRTQTDAKYVQELLPKVTDPVIRRYWTDQIAQTADFHKSEILDYLVSKFGRFITNKTMRNIIGQSNSSLNFRKIMDEQKILIVRLNKGALGEENAQFLGLVLVPRILMAALSRTDMPEAERKDFYLYVDEFQNFATPDFATILSEARKYRLSLIMANQFVSQIEQEIRDAIFGNVGTIMCYRVGADDAGNLVRQFDGVFNEQDLQNIDKYNLFVKTIVDNEPVPPFTMDIFKDMDALERRRNRKVGEMIRELSRLKYGKDVAEVEREISSRSNL